jgi:parallel beta-helix repeat protein
MGVDVRTTSRWLASALVALGVGAGPTVGQETTEYYVVVRPGDDLARVLDEAADHTEIRLSPGTYELRGLPYEEPVCGNCEDPDTRVRSTVGAFLRGRDMRVIGPAGADATIIRTNAGYGIYVEDCTDCVIEGVTVTGGERDADANAVDAGIVVKNSTVTVRSSTIRDNIGDPDTVTDTVVGIMGIAGLEGAVLIVEDCTITRNSWDGIALYRDSEAVIRDNVIDGVDRARGAQVGGGRGVGIGATWNARAEIQGNVVRNYWKGIGLFVDADATVSHNVVEHILTWGISLWDAGTGKPKGRIEKNIIYDTGACGIAVVREHAADTQPGFVRRNAIVRSGQDPRYDSGEPYCHQTAIAEHAVPPTFRIVDNLFFDNREPGDKPGANDLPPGGFQGSIRPLVLELRDYPALAESEFLTEIVW